MERHDIRITGEGTVGGGSYGSIKITGEGRIAGEVEASELHVTGEVTAESAVRLGKIKITGEGRFAAVQAGGFSVSGSVNFKGPAAVKDMEVMGELRAFDGIKADRIKIRGSLEDKKGVEAEQFDSYGAIDVNSLNADSINIKLYGESRADEIVGSTINIIYPIFRKIISGLLFFKRNSVYMRAGNIEADRIYLERTAAGTVKGNDVSIGPKCRIKVVEYRDRISVDKSSVVESQVKI